MSDDDQGDLFGWRFARNAAREPDQQSGGDREGRADIGDRRRSSPRAKIVLFPGGHSDSAKRPACPVDAVGPLFAFATAQAALSRARARGHAQKEATAEPRAKPVAFPLSRRRPLVARLFKLMKEASSPGEAERILQGRLARLRRTLRRKHVPEPVIARDLARLDAAVHALLPAPRTEGQVNGR
jgi:hypothetical protein